MENTQEEFAPAGQQASGIGRPSDPLPSDRA
jgi:hypothetical protein